MMSIQKIAEVMRLSLSLAKVNFKLRNEGSYLGILWYLLNPLLLFATILFVKNQAFDHVEILYYPVFLLVGLLMYNFFVQATTAAIELIPTNGQFIKSIKIDTEALVVSRVLQSVFSHLFECVLLAVLLVYFGLSIVWLPFYFLVLASFILFVLGVSFFLATLGVYVSDFKNIWVIFCQLLLFITPILYEPIEGTVLYSVNQYNPLFLFIEIARGSLINHAPLSLDFLWLTLVSCAILWLGAQVFSYYKKSFAEMV